MQIEVLELAKLEIDDAREYYNLQTEKLGDSFRDDIKSCIDRIVLFPELYPRVVQDIRKSLLHRFPYSLFYVIEDETIIVLSVAHQSRKPHYWVSDLVKD